MGMTDVGKQGLAIKAPKTEDMSSVQDKYLV